MTHGPKLVSMGKLHVLQVPEEGWGRERRGTRRGMEQGRGRMGRKEGRLVAEGQDGRRGGRRKGLENRG